MIRSAKRDGDGFNILELMIVVAILGILIGITVATYVVSIQNARTITCLANQRVLGDASTMYLAKTGAPPTDIEDLRPYANTFDKITHCPSDDGTLFTWNAATEEIECANHPR